jgi:hypothetical protein
LVLIPRNSDWWLIDDEVLRDVSSEMWELIRENHEYLTEIGKSGTKRLIREELRRLKDEARQDVAWAATKAVDTHKVGPDYRMDF